MDHHDNPEAVFFWIGGIGGTSRRQTMEMTMWPWRDSHVPYGYGSVPINTIFRGMNIHLPAIFMFTRGTRFWPTAIYFCHQFVAYPHVFESDSNFSCSNDGYCVFCFHSLVFILYVFFHLCSIEKSRRNYPVASQTLNRITCGSAQTCRILGKTDQLMNHTCSGM